MAQYFHLNIYKSALSLLAQITNLIAKFDRNYRFTLGEKLQETTINFIVTIYKANSSTGYDERIEYINSLIEKMQYINIYLRLCQEVKAISKEKYIEIAFATQDMEKQLSGWLAYSMGRVKKKDEARI